MAVKTGWMAGRWHGLNALWLALALLAVGCGSDDDGAAQDGDDGLDTEPVATLIVRNESDLTVWYLYVSPSTSETWGPDQLGGDLLTPGESITVNDVPCDREYDFKAAGDRNVNLKTRRDTFLPCDETVVWTLN